jgi:hypothetical protein
MGTEMVPEKSVILNQETQLIAQEDFINVSHCKSFRSYKNTCTTFNKIGIPEYIEFPHIFYETLHSECS